MADALTTRSQSNSSELADLAESYRRKRQEIVEQNEEAIKSLKSEYREKQANERESGEAAVNHIRKEVRSRIETARNNEAEALEGENKQETAQIKSMRSHNLSEEEALKTQRDNQDKFYTDAIAKARQEKARALGQEYEQTKTFQAGQAVRRSEIQKSTTQELSELQQKVALEKAKTVASNRSEMNTIDHEHREQLSKSQEDFKNKIENERTRTFSTIQHQRDTTEKAFESETQKQSQMINNMRAKLSEEYKKTRTDGEQKIEVQRKTDDKVLNAEVNRGTQELDITRQRYDAEIKDVHARGRGEVDLRKNDYTQQLKKEDNYYQGEIKKRNTDHEVGLQKNEELYRQKLIEQGDLNNKAMKNQTEEYQKSFNINEKANQHSLHEQHDRFVDSAIKQKSNLIERFGKYEDAKDDPFYKMHEFETRISENDNFYVVKTKVPAHEKHNVDVIVKNDRVVVSGQREFAEKVDKEGRKVATNTVESFREEIPLKHPTIAKAVDKRYEDGAIVVKVPKIPIA